MLMSGLFISFEGIDFSGKTVQCQRLREILEAAGYPVLAIREPGGTRISESIRQILLDGDHAAMSARAEILLYSAARAQIVYEVIQPALAQGKMVLADRFVDSTTAYQGYGRNLDREFVRHVNEFATTSLLPDVTFFIDVSIAVAAERRRLSGRTADRLEVEAMAFYQRVREGYSAIARQSAGRVVTIPGERSIESITAKICDHLKKKFDLKVSAVK
jgi:dTMP kinase